MSVDWILSQLLGTEAVIAARAVREAADLADWLHREGSVGVLSKSDASPVTAADFAAQALVADRLASAFPDVPLVAEEDASDLRGIKANGLQAHVIDVVRRVKPGIDAARVLDSIDRGRGMAGRRYWTLDPIDGTKVKGFLRGGRYAVALALVEDGTPLIGILACPRLSFRGASITRATDDAHDLGVAIAVRDRGAWWVSPAAAEIHATQRIGNGGSNACPSAALFRNRAQRHRPIWEHAAHARREARPDIARQPGQTRCSSGRPCRSVASFSHQRRLSRRVWDHAAGALLVSEAGGQVSDLAGRLSISPPVAACRATAAFLHPTAGCTTMR